MKISFLIVIFNLFFYALHTNQPGKQYIVQLSQKKKVVKDSYGAIRRGDTTVKEIALVFSADEFFEGVGPIIRTLKQNKIQASFFLTGNAYRKFPGEIKKIRTEGHYLGAHSDKHLLYADWGKRDSTLVTEEIFIEDINANYSEMKKAGIEKKDAKYFLPAYEWYNAEIVKWTGKTGLKLVNFTPGTRSNADYTFPAMGKRYVSSKDIFNSITSFEEKNSSGLNGFILLLHAGAGPQRTDKFYDMLPSLVEYLKEKKYRFVRIDKLLGN